MNEQIGQLAFPQRESQWPQDRTYSESTAQVLYFSYISFEYYSLLFYS